MIYFPGAREAPGPGFDHSRREDVMFVHVFVWPGPIAHRHRASDDPHGSMRHGIMAGSATGQTQLFAPKQAS